MYTHKNTSMLPSPLPTPPTSDPCFLIDAGGCPCRNAIYNAIYKSFGRIIRAYKAKLRNTSPPINVTVRTEILVATMRPPITATPVQMKWPTTPPLTTP